MMYKQILHSRLINQDGTPYHENVNELASERIPDFQSHIINCSYNRVVMTVPCHHGHFQLCDFIFNSLKTLSKTRVKKFSVILPCQNSSTLLT